MCESCLDLVDAVVGPIMATGTKQARIPCYHEPPCTYRRLAPGEAEEWMWTALPRTWALLVFGRQAATRQRRTVRMEARKA